MAVTSHNPHPSAKTSHQRRGARGIRAEVIGMDQIETVRTLNIAIFDEERIINTFDRDDVLILLAYVDDQPAGFKLGYKLYQDTFYSAKGGVLPEYRRQGIARLLLHEMIAVVRARGYTRFTYDTFPNKHPGMTVLGLAEGFRVVKAGYSPQYKDYRLRFEKEV